MLKAHNASTAKSNTKFSAKSHISNTTLKFNTDKQTKTKPKPVYSFILYARILTLITASMKTMRQIVVMQKK